MEFRDDATSGGFFVGTKADLKPGDLIEPHHQADAHSEERSPGFVYLTSTLDAAVWEAEVTPGEGPGRVYIVEPTGPVMDDPDPRSYPIPMDSYRSEHALRVTGEYTDSSGYPPYLYHGTKADLEPGDLIMPGFLANFGEPGRVANHVYLTGTLNAAIWGAELALGDGPGRIYVVEPTGPIVDDPNVTNAKYPGNPTKSYRSRDALRVIGEHVDWQGHPPDVVGAMKDGLERLSQSGEAVIDD